ncbi:hypothetical protein M2244_000134 [Rhodoferax antarcticus]|uniref:Uncharacterized protein n=1 Tax=Rhodoferax antarcticus ANT.BR TaxID=1111071 RepID=A0A1Q8YDS8_9BURK|nr:hypothetical protein [Rhodoferax antarcticus]OLP06163.1 hypothetical protein BLL52_2394 [Rhodoferax antarcticus ANT.BR]
MQGLPGEGLPLGEIYLDELVCVGRVLGKQWSSNQIDLTEVTFEIHCLQQILYQFSLQFMRQTAYKSNDYRVIFFATPKPRHSFAIVVLVTQGADLLCGYSWYPPLFVFQHV